MNLQDTLAKLSGRFATITLRNKEKYCAALQSVGEKTISFLDVNSQNVRRVKHSDIASVRSGSRRFVAA